MQSLLADIIVNRMIAAFCWMLIHSLWQGMILAMITVIILMLTKRLTAAARYNLVLVLSTVFMLAPVSTFIWELNNYTAGTATATLTTTLGLQISQLFFGNPHLKQIPDTAIAFFSAHEQFIVIAWFAIFAVKITKMFVALFYNRQIKERQISQPAPHWKNRISRLSKTLHIKKAVVLLESGYMKMPVVIGHIKPVILMPFGLLTSLPAEQVEAILLHELAHIRRNDYLVNIFQYIVETIFFFNPAIVWISACLREERENCCDDIALSQTQNKQGLVEALVSFKQYELYGRSYATAFPGKKDHLLRRVTRIMAGTDSVTALPGKLFYLIAFIVLLAGAGTIMLTQKKEAAEIKAAVYDSAGKITDHNLVVTVPTAPAVQKEVHAKVTAILKKINATKKIVPVKKIALQETIVTEDQTVLYNEKLIAIARAKAMKDQANALLDQKKAFYDQQHAMLDQQQAMNDQAKAKLDQEQAMKNQALATLDQAQATKDQMQAKLNQEEAMKKQAISKSDAVQAKINQQQALQYKKDAERMKLQTQSF
jgi:bla regulator protein blaR1